VVYGSGNMRAELFGKGGASLSLLSLSLSLPLSSSAPLRLCRRIGGDAGVSSTS